MSDLQNQTPADTYKGLLQVGDYTDGITNNTGASALQVTDGAGVNTALALSTTRVGVGNSSPQAELDVNGNVVADEYALDQTGTSSSAVAIHAPATNELAIRTNSTEAIRIDSSGNVGIGTTSPGEKLVIEDSTSDVVTQYRANNNYAGQIIGKTSGIFSLNGRLGLDFNFTGNQTSAMRIDSAGNVGIGSTDPNQKITIGFADNGTDGISFRSSTYPNLAKILAENENSSTNGNLQFHTRLAGDINEAMRIDSAGNVGIGTASPAYALDINGDSDTGWGTRIINDSTASEASGLIVRCNGGTSGDALRVHSDNEELFRVRNNGNIGIGTMNFGTNASGVIGIANATAPTTAPADMVQLYAKDDAGSSALYVRNEANTETILSPHAADAPNSLYDRPPGVEEMHRSANYYLGTIVFTNVDRRNALLQKQLNGEELPEDRTFTVTETFAEYNARTGANLQVEDWDANQQAMADANESYVKKPKPDWLP
jgi:hypothetical protein